MKIDKSVFNRTGNDRPILNSKINLRINNNDLKEFKEVCGPRGYQAKIRELMRAYVDYINQIDTLEQRKRQNYLNSKNQIDTFQSK